MDKAVICKLELDEAKVKQFKDAIENSYWFEFFIGMFWAVFFRCVVCVDESVVVHMFIRYQFVKASVYLMVKIPLLCLCFLPSVSLYHAAWVCACGFFFGGLHDLLNYILEVSFVYWDAHCLLFCPFVSGLWSLGFWLQVQMICHYGVCIHWTYIVVLFSQFDWIIYSWIYPYLYFRFCGWIASW